MSFSNVHFILYKPQLPENIGACARALKNFNFRNLSVVSPKISFPNKKALATSVGAKNIIQSCKIYNNFEKSIKNFNCIIGTTTRIRNKNYKYISVKNLKNIDYRKKVAFIFGPEASGLSNHELGYANYIIKLPTNPKFESLNLSHSIIILCYELFKLLNKNVKKCSVSSKVKLVKKKDLIKLTNFLLNSLDNIGFLQPVEKRKIMIENIRSIFMKMNLSEKETRILSSILGSLIKKKVN